MKKGRVVKRKNDLSIPWFVQIEKSVIMPYKTEKELFYSIKPPDYVTALTQTKKNEFVLLKQYRPAVEDYTFELPSGHLEKGESPTEAMIRELKEETGYISGHVTLLGEIIPDTGRLENRLWAFYVQDVKTGQLLMPEENDGMEVHLVSYEKLLKMIDSGQLKHALDLSVIALAIFKKHFNPLKVKRKKTL